MIDNIQDMEWKDKDTLRTMVSKYNSNLNKISTEVNHIVKESADGTVVSENTGYARVCEWKDGNRLEEERYGYFVEQSDDLRVSIANSDSAVLGVTARKPAFASNVTDNMYNRDELTANLCYVVLIGSTTVKQDGTITANTKYCINSNGIATASEGIGYKVTRVIDSENIVIEVSPATELIKQAYTELFNKIENKKAGLIEVDYATWTNLSDEERVALGDVIVPNYPIDYSLEDVKKNVDKLSTDVTEIKSTIENSDFGSGGSGTCTCAKYLKVNEETNFVYDSAITTTLVDGVLKNVFNADENLSIYKDRDETKFSLGTITYTSAVEVDLRIEDDNAWRWYYILPISAEQSTVDLTTVEWVLSGYQPNHEDTEEKPTDPTISTVGFITFLLENSSDASDTATFDIYDLSNVTTKTARVILSNPSENSTLELLPTSVQYNGKNLVRSVNGLSADSYGNVNVKVFELQKDVQKSLTGTLSATLTNTDGTATKTVTKSYTKYDTTTPYGSSGGPGYVFSSNDTFSFGVTFSRNPSVTTSDSNYYRVSSVNTSKAIIGIYNYHKHISTGNTAGLENYTRPAGTATATGQIISSKVVSKTVSKTVNYGVTYKDTPTISNIVGCTISDIGTTACTVTTTLSTTLSSGQSTTLSSDFSFDVLGDAIISSED